VLITFGKALLISKLTRAQSSSSYG